MKEYELLSRSSAFLVKKDPAKYPFGRHFHIVACAHVTHPWKWRKYYPQEWLDEVSSSIAKFEFRNSDGHMTDDFETCEKIFAHPSLDLCVAHLVDETEVKWQSDLNSISPISINKVDAVQIDAPVSFSGYTLVNQEENTQKYTHINGIVNIAQKTRVFCSSEQVLEMGMCGGLVFEGDQFRGMIEGIVDKNNKVDPILNDKALYIPASEIEKFLHTVEMGEEDSETHTSSSKADTEENW